MEPNTTDTFVVSWQAYIYSRQDVKPFEVCSQLCDVFKKYLYYLADVDILYYLSRILDLKKNQTVRV